MIVSNQQGCVCHILTFHVNGSVQDGGLVSDSFDQNLLI